MTETKAGPEPESARRQGSRAAGILGAFLGALLGYFLWMCVIFATFYAATLPDESRLWDLFFLLVCTLPGFCSCLGYRLFRGYREMKFAWRVVRLCVVFSAPAASILFIAAAVLYYADGWMDLPLGWSVFLASLRVFTEAEPWKVLLPFVLASLLFARLSAPLLLKYADPDWYSDPRRIAQSNGGGALFNHPALWPLPKAEHLSTSFQVDKGKITVEGEHITAKGRWGKVSTFDLREVAGVVLGPGGGFNVLYDGENRVLAKFAWSRKGAETFGQYLIAHNIPFTDLNGQPVDTAGQRVSLPRQFEVREGKACLVVGVICLVVFGILALLCLLVLDKLAILIALAVFLFFILMGVWMLLSYKNRRMTVEGDTLTYTTVFGRTTQFRVSEAGSLRFRFGLGTREIRDREGRLLARFEDNMKGAALLVEYLNQHMTPAEGQ